MAYKKLNVVVDKAINIYKKQDIAANKKPNTAVELSLLITDQITKQVKLRS